MSGVRVKESKPTRSDVRKATTVEGLGAVPRVDLLPPEVHERQRTATARRTVLLLVVLAVVIVGGAFTFANLLVTQSGAALAAEQQRTLDLLSQQGEYVEVRQVQNRVDASLAAERVGTSTEIDWQFVVGQIQAAQPPGTTLQTVKTDAATPIVAFPQSVLPLESPRIASVEFTASSLTVPDVAGLLDALAAGVTGAVDVVYVQTLESGGAYVTTILVYLDARALANIEQAETEEGDGE